MNVHDLEVMEGLVEADEFEVACSMQRSINSGVGWRMQGSVGRGLMDALKAGVVMLGEAGQFDYYGNYIPSRYEVKPGSFGSYAFVADRKGDDYAKQLSKVK